MMTQLTGVSASVWTKVAASLEGSGGGATAAGTTETCQDLTSRVTLSDVQAADAPALSDVQTADGPVTNNAPPATRQVVATVLSDMGMGLPATRVAGFTYHTLLAA